MNQLPLIPIELPNSSVHIDQEDMKMKMQHPICYIFDIGECRIDTIIKVGHFQSSSIDPSAVDIKHDGVLKLSNNFSIDKLSIKYSHTKNFEDVYDYLNPNSRISKVLVKKNITAYYSKNKILVSANNKDSKNIINCIKDQIIRTIKESKNPKADEYKKTILNSSQLNIDKFMKYLIEEHDANVKAIYAGELQQKENKAITIYGDQANKSSLYDFIKTQGNKLSCITVKFLLKNSPTPRNILFTKDSGVMIQGSLSEELAINLIWECNNIIESFLINESNY